jgi:hypothetical protein
LRRWVTFGISRTSRHKRLACHRAAGMAGLPDRLRASWNRPHDLVDDAAMALLAMRHRDRAGGGVKGDASLENRDRDRS